jgi:hypothetical protein
MGVCASDSRLGLRALRDWCQALQLEYVMPDCKVGDTQQQTEADSRAIALLSLAQMLCC